MTVAFDQLPDIKRVGKSRSSGAGLIYLYLAFNADKSSGKVRRSTRTIAKQLDASESQVEKSIALLVRSGLLTKQLDDRKGGRWPVTVYTLLDPSASDAGRTDRRSARDRAPSVRGATHRPHSGTGDPGTPRPGKKTRRRHRKSPSLRLGESSEATAPPSRVPKRRAVRTSRRPDGDRDGGPHSQRDLELDNTLDLLVERHGEQYARKFWSAFGERGVRNEARRMTSPTTTKEASDGTTT
jgi:hypothetical protein